MPCRIESDGNHIAVVGSLALLDLRKLTAALHNLTTRLGYEDLVLDFTQCDRAFPAPMAGLCAQALNLHSKSIDTELRLLPEPRLATLFLNANWAHLIDPHRFAPSRYRGYTNLPVVSFATPEEQTRVVNRLIDAVLCSIPTLERVDLQAIEWSLNEITDNVLVHARSAVGGLVQLSSYKHRQRVEFVVADPGIGIPASLREGHPELGEDLSALERAIREGVTRDPEAGQGNGLYGTFQIARASGGYMQIHSGYARLTFESDQLRWTREDVPFNGALLNVCIDCANPVALADALRFGGKQYIPLDYIDTHFEDRASEDIVFRLADEAQSFGSRVAGEPVRNKLVNLLRMNSGRSIVVDLSDVALVSSSFADEVFGKLFVSLGPLQFSQVLTFRHVDATVRGLIDKAIMQRSAQIR